jgi:nucleoid DNA-binding protein
MNKNNLINKILKETGVSRSEVTRIVNQTFESIIFIILSLNFLAFL